MDHINWILLLLVDQSQNMINSNMSIQISYHVSVSKPSTIVSVWIFVAHLQMQTCLFLLIAPQTDVPPRTFAALLSCKKYALFHSPGYPNATGLRMDLRGSNTPMARLLLERIKGIFLSPSTFNIELLNTN
jgi:hypothetical protein